MAVLSGHEFTLEIASFLTPAESLAVLLPVSFHELIMAAVLRAATLWLLSCGHTVAAR